MTTPYRDEPETNQDVNINDDQPPARLPTHQTARATLCKTR